MKTKMLIALVFAIVFVSCKKEEGKSETGAAPKVEGKQRFSVELNVTSTNDENFPVYFTEDHSNNFDGDHAVWTGVKGGNVDQTVTLDLPEEVIPTNIRIDFGIKKGQERGDVTLKKFKLNFYDKSFEARGSDFLKYFIKNDSTETTVDEAQGTITFKKNPKSKLEPFYYPQQSILDEIKKMTGN